MNNQQLAHVWAQQKRESAKGSSFYFEGPTIYSYGPHFPIARCTEDAHGRRCVLFTYRGYSNTTSKHIGHARQALHGLNIPLYYVYNPASVPGIGDAEYFVKEALSYMAQAQRARSRKEFLIAQAKANEQRFFEFCKAFQILHPDRRKKSILNTAKIVELVQEENERAKLHRERAKERKAELQKSHDQKRAEWRAGERESLPFECSQPVMLRIRDGEVITSRGASVPLEEARELYKIASVQGVPYLIASRRVKIGEFTIDDFRDGNIIAGCHSIPWSEIQRLFTLNK